MIHLEANDISCCRGARTLFSDIDLTLQSGEAIQLVGHNGSGKTSLLRILATLRDPETGDIFWDGCNTKENNEVYKSNFSYLGHRLGLNAHLTVTQNLSYHRAIKKILENSDLQQILKILSIEKYADYKCGHLSSGIQKRVALARMIICDTPLWLMDEPANALDQQGIALLENILSYKLSSGGMVVFSSHLPLRFQPGEIKTISLENQQDMGLPL